MMGSVAHPGGDKPFVILLILRWLLPSIVCICVLSSCTPPAKTVKSEGLFNEAEEVILETRTDPKIIRKRQVTTDLELLPLNARELAPKTYSVKLNLFDDVLVTGVIHKVERNNTGGVNLSGHVDGYEHSIVLLVTQDSLLSGAILYSGKMFAIRYSGEEDIHYIIEFDPSAFILDEDYLPNKIPGVDILDHPGSVKSDDVVVDVMFVYTENARDAAGSISAMENMINVAILYANETYERSGIAHRLNLVHSAEINYTESEVHGTDRDRMIDTTDPYLNEVNEMRDEYYADLVTLIGEYDLPGISWVMEVASTSYAPYGYNVVDIGSLETYVYAHETGHNLGARHDWYVDPTTTPLEYCHGYVDLENDWRTIMAYPNECEDVNGENCDRIGYWSNPDMEYNGAPLGVPEDETEPANNVLCLNTTAPIVADYRVAPVGVGDRFEPDDTYDQAGIINNGIPQIHTIDPVGDVDWARFLLYGSYAISLETTGASRSDTTLWLYRKDQLDGSLQAVDVDHDFGTNRYSRIQRVCGVDALPPGEYYAYVEENGHDAAIPSYTLILTKDEDCGQNVPDIAVKSEDGILIPVQQNFPSTEDGTDFGNVEVISASVAHTFRIWNDGPAPLQLFGNPGIKISGPHASDFRVSTFPSNWIVDPGGGYVEFELTFNPKAVGERRATIKILNNDPDEYFYNFRVIGVGMGDPEMTVRASTYNLIEDGDTTPDANERTDFGSRDTLSSPLVRSFNIFNDGGATLNLTGSPIVEISGPHTADFTAISQPNIRTVGQEGGYVSFELAFDPVATGVRTATVSIANDDSDENPYDFTIQGTGTGAEHPEMAVISNEGVLIPDGDTSPSTAEGTDFSSVGIDGETAVRSFQIWNDGGEALQLTGSPMVTISGPHASDFTVTAQPGSASVAPWGNYVEFEVTFDPSAFGVRTATINIASDDSNENPYTFDVRGNFQTKLIAPGGSAGDAFGYSVAISGDTAIVGALNEKDGAGAAYIFTNIAGVWTQTAKLVALDRMDVDHFGSSVAISGDTAIVGAYGDEDNGKESGAVYVFVNDAGSWTLVNKLIPSDNAQGDFFGWSVAIDGDTIIASAPGDENDGKMDGSAYIYQRTNKGWINSETAKLVITENPDRAHFGWSVSISGDTAVVGAWTNYNSQMPFWGLAYAFEDVAGNWEQVSALADPDRYSHAFGMDVAIFDHFIVVGDPGGGMNGSSSGAGYIFDDKGGVWDQLDLATPLDGAPSHGFGLSVAISEDANIIISARMYGGVYGGQDKEPVYIFQLTSPGSWTQTAKEYAFDAVTGTNFGYSVAISGGTVIVGAPADDENGMDSGAVYIFTIQSN